MGAAETHTARSAAPLPVVGESSGAGALRWSRGVALLLVVGSVPAVPVAAQELGGGGCPVPSDPTLAQGHAAVHASTPWIHDVWGDGQLASSGP